MPKEIFDPMDMKSLRCFETMARHGSLTRASIELDISDAAVSQRVRSLEKYLGTKLYEARGGKVRLTDAGHRTHDLAVRLLDELADFTDEIGGEEGRGTIVLTAEPPILRYQLPPVVERFQRDRSVARLRLLSRGTSDTIELVRRNEVDLGVIHFRKSLPSETAFYPWRTFKAYILVPRDHPLARDKIPTIDEILSKETLSRYPQVVAEIGDDERLRVKETLESLGLPFNVSLEVGNTETVKYYVARGHGLAVVPGMCLAREDEAIFHIIEVPREFEGDTTYGVLVRKDKYVSRGLRTLLTLLDVPDEDENRAAE
jgi:DNA-binding transcriptional LysR family regulator